MVQCECLCVCACERRMHGSDATEAQVHLVAVVFQKCCDT